MPVNKQMVPYSRRPEESHSPLGFLVKTFGTSTMLEDLRAQRQLHVPGCNGLRGRVLGQ